jgi:hypothetical protein
MSDHDNIEALAEKIRRGDALTAEETMAVFKTADPAGLLYYKMLTMVREQRSLTELPATLKEILKTGAWQRWRWVGSMFAQNSLDAYLTSPPPNGVGIQLDTVEKLIADDPDALTAYREATTAPAHRVAGSHYNVMTSVQGNSRAYTLDVLKREYPELFERVKAGELSANAAAIQAGFRKKPKPLKELRRWWNKASEEERAEFLDWVNQLKNS